MGTRPLGDFLRLGNVQVYHAPEGAGNVRRTRLRALALWRERAEASAEEGTREEIIATAADDFGLDELSLAQFGRVALG